MLRRQTVPLGWKLSTTMRLEVEIGAGAAHIARALQPDGRFASFEGVDLTGVGDSVDGALADLFHRFADALQRRDQRAFDQELEESRARQAR